MEWNKYFRGVIPTDLHWYLNQDPVINIVNVEFLKQLDALIKACIFSHKHNFFQKEK